MIKYVVVMTFKYDGKNMTDNINIVTKLIFNKTFSLSSQIATHWLLNNPVYEHDNNHKDINKYLLILALIHFSMKLKTKQS